MPAGASNTSFLKKDKVLKNQVGSKEGGRKERHNDPNVREKNKHK